MLVFTSLVIIGCMIARTNGFSSGLDIPECDAYSPKYGCSPTNFVNGNRLDCSEDGQIMDWVTKAVDNTAFKVSAGARTAPTTTYTPGRIININLDVVQYGMLYRGLLMYAETNAGARVGRWVNSQEDPAYVRPSSLCANTITHASAMLKPYQLTMQWQAPAAGAGPVTFKALIKVGNANTGEFYHPGNILTLQEGTAPPEDANVDLLWVRGGLGETCTAACTEQGRVCDPESFGTIASGGDVADEIAPLHSCKLPYLSQCSAVGATSSSDDFCYYQENPTVCASETRPSGAVTCDSSSTSLDDGRRFCPCRLPAKDDSLTGCSGCPCNADKSCNSLYNTCNEQYGICARAEQCDGLPGCPCLSGNKCLRDTWLCDAANNLCKPPADSGDVGCPGCPCAADEDCVTAFAPICFQAPQGTCVAVNCKLGAPGCPCTANGGCEINLACYGGICGRTFVENGSAGARGSRASFVALAVGAVFALTNSPRMMLVVALLALVSGAEAHNWMNTLSRSSGASTDSPCKPPISRFPVAQIARNQTLRVEWMTNHGSDTYFAVVRKEDEEKLKFHTEALLDEYLENAPTGTFETGMTDTRFAKLHVKLSGSLANKDVTNYFAREITAGDPLWDLRNDDVLKGTIYGDMYPFASAPRLMQYKPTETSTDMRAAYANARMPWILSVSRYAHKALQGTGPDMARIAVQTDLKDDPLINSGRYVVHWMWRGYYDCVDVDFIDRDQAVANVYGVAATSETWTRIDHSTFSSVNMTYGPCFEVVGDDVSACQQRCQMQSIENCFGVIVAPLSYPDPVARAGFSNVNVIPWGSNGCNKADFANAAKTSMVCLAVRPNPSTDTVQEVQSTHYVHDPVFYSTVYYRVGGRIFETAASNAPPPKKHWRFQEECMDCKDVSINALESVQAPRWSFADNCVNCDVEPQNAVDAEKDQKFVDMASMVQSASGQACRAAPADTTCATQDCTKRLRPVGFPSNNIDWKPNQVECGILARAEPTCGPTVIFNGTLCECYLANPVCCGQCQQVARTNSNIYTLQ